MSKPDFLSGAIRYGVKADSMSENRLKGCARLKDGPIFFGTAPGLIA